MLSPESASINLELHHGYLGGGGVVSLKKNPINYASGDSILTKQSTCGYLQNMKELLSVVCSDLSLPPSLSPHLSAQSQYLLTPIRQFPKSHL